jgi:hypothetical protein
MKNFSVLEERESDPRLGDYLGSYIAADLKEVEVRVYERGLIWPIDGRTNVIRYNDIKKIEYPEATQSLSLILLLTDGTRRTLPIVGTDGRFFDSMEFSRFIARAISDSIA